MVPGFQKKWIKSENSRKQQQNLIQKWLLKSRYEYPEENLFAFSSLTAPPNLCLDDLRTEMHPS